MITPDEFLGLLYRALERVRDPIRYLEGREQSFQAALYAELQQLLPPDASDDGMRLEQEVTKSLARHGLDARPDLILHVPFELERTRSRLEGNLVVVELKVRATLDEARDDYRKLGRMCDQLEYAMGVFINIDSTETFRDVHQGLHNDRLFGFAVRLLDGVVSVVGPVGSL